MRMNLKVERVKHNMTQDEVAFKTCISRPTYAAIESGVSFGSHDFWKKVQTLFGISDARMWEVMQNDEN